MNNVRTSLVHEIETWAWWGAACKTIPLPKIFGSESPEMEEKSELKMMTKQKRNCDVIFVLWPLCFIKADKQLKNLDAPMAFYKILLLLLSLLTF